MAGLVKARSELKQKLARAASGEGGWQPEGGDHFQEDETGPKKGKKGKKKGAGKGEDAGGGGGG